MDLLQYLGNIHGIEDGKVPQTTADTFLKLVEGYMLRATHLTEGKTKGPADSLWCPYMPMYALRTSSESRSSRAVPEWTMCPVWMT